MNVHPTWDIVAALTKKLTALFIDGKCSIAKVLNIGDAATSNPFDESSRARSFVVSHYI